MASDNWVEVLKCPKCGKTGLAELSAGDDAFEGQADLVPVGFKVVQLEPGINFNCTACDVRVEP
jgi:hypothetical protein